MAQGFVDLLASIAPLREALLDSERVSHQGAKARRKIGQDWKRCVDAWQIRFVFPEGSSFKNASRNRRVLPQDLYQVHSMPAYLASFAPLREALVDSERVSRQGAKAQRKRE